MRDELEYEHDGPLYFPFALSDKRPPRAAQAYLVKLPLSVVREFRLPHEEVPLRETDTPATAPPAPRTRVPAPAGAERRQVEPIVRRAIEKHAVRAVEEVLRSDGWATLDVGDFKPYDIEATRSDEVLHVEVKGSTTSDVYTIELTRGEVGHAASDRTLLAVVEGIAWSDAGGQIQTSGGRVRLWWDWVPEESSLVPTLYRYTLPEG